MIDKVQKIREQVEKLKSQLLKGACASQIAMETRCKEEAYDEVLTILDTMQEKPVSDDLEKEIGRYFKENGDKWAYIDVASHFANWQKEHLWKPADGDDLPIFDREVIVLIKYNTQRNIHDKEYSTYKVGFGHRPNPDGWDGKSITTGKVEHYTPKTYDKGGWNAPDIAYWLDVELPKEIEL